MTAAAIAPSRSLVSVVMEMIFQSFEDEGIDGLDWEEGG